MLRCFLVLAVLLCGCLEHEQGRVPSSGIHAPVRRTFPAKVVGVHDGDSCRAVIDGKETVIRLEGIDAPELGQPFGRNAKKHLSDLVFGKVVEITPTGVDRYQRTLALITSAGKPVNRDMVLQGFAWHFVKYSKDPKLAEAELRARAAKRGLWADAAPVPPWGWRKGEGK